MIKITIARPLEKFTLELCFSDETTGEYDFCPIIERDTILTRPLRDLQYFRSYYLELGALAWPNGLEFSGDAIHKTLRDAGKLQATRRLAHGV
jgi:hypothetical protein